jgi:hypothetical protein
MNGVSASRPDRYEADRHREEKQQALHGSVLSSKRVFLLVGVA